MPRFLLLILFFLSYLLSNADSLLDSLYKKSDIVLQGQIQHISEGLTEDMGTEFFLVTIAVEHIYKQNFYINAKEAPIIWEVSNLKCIELNLKQCIKKYESGNWIFFLNQSHFFKGDQISEERIVAYNSNIANSLLEIEENNKKEQENVR